MLSFMLALPLGLVALGAVLEPDPRGWGTHEQLGFQPCWPMSSLDTPCPGCGVTTAIALAVHGQPWASFLTQPFGWVALVGALTGAWWALRAHVRERDLFAELPYQPWKRVGLVLGSAMLAAWLYKLALVRGWGA